MEQQLLFAVNKQWTNRPMDVFMAVMSSFDLWIVPLVFAALCLLIFGGFNGRAFVIVAGLLVGISDGAVSQHLKKLVGRPRPDEVLAGVRRVELARVKPKIMAVFTAPRVKFSKRPSGKTGGNSFPSSHTTNNFCLAVTAWAFFRRWGWLVFIPAICVAYSRVYTGAHWPSDAAASAFLGCAIALLCLPLCELAWRKLAPRWLPSIAVAHPALLGKAPA
jgi:undecaprenyl-diphosphatase